MKSTCSNAKDANKIFDLVLEEICKAGVSVVIVCVEEKENKEYYDWDGDKLYHDELSIDFEILRTFGLIERIGTDFFELEHGVISVVLYHMTELGYDFWSACCIT